MASLDIKEEPLHVTQSADPGKTAIDNENQTEREQDPVEEVRLVRKIDRHLLPMLWVMYM